MGHFWGEEELLQEELDALMKLLAEGKVKPRVDKVFRLEQGAEAHRFIHDRKNVGKVLFDCT